MTALAQATTTAEAVARPARPLRLAILGPARFPVGQPFAGGMEAHTHALATELSARGHDVIVYAAAGEGHFRIDTLLPVAAADAGRRDVLGGAAVELSEHVSYLDAMMRLSAAGHDVVHINAVHHLPFACSAMVPGVVSGTLHTPPEPWLAAAVVTATRGPRPIRLTSVSDVNAAAWAGVGVDVGVIPNGVDLAAWPAGPGGTGAVWSGRLVPEKAPHLAIDAARLAGVTICLYGPIHDDAYFAAEIKPRLGATARYGGHVPAWALAAALGRAAVAIVTPAWEEPFGLVVAEALACGTPVAGFRRGALLELLDGRTGVLADPDDVDGLATAIAAATQLSRADCRRAAEERFSLDVMADRYEEWFLDLCAADQ